MAQGIGSMAGAAALVDSEPISKAILTGVAAVSGAVGLIFGDPKAIRQHQIDQALKYNQFMAPVSINATMSTGGTYSDLDRFGNVRTSALSPFPQVQQGYFDYRNNTVVPGRTLSQFGGPTGGMTVNINAMDSKSIVDNHAAIADAVAVAMQRGSSPSFSEQLSARAH
jgi:hypothetical protein